MKYTMLALVIVACALSSVAVRATPNPNPEDLVPRPERRPLSGFVDLEIPTTGGLTLVRPFLVWLSEDQAIVPIVHVRRPGESTGEAWPLPSWLRVERSGDTVSIFGLPLEVDDDGRGGVSFTATPVDPFVATMQMGEGDATTFDNICIALMTNMVLSLRDTTPIDITDQCSDCAENGTYVEVFIRLGPNRALRIRVYEMGETCAVLMCCKIENGSATSCRGSEDPNWEECGPDIPTPPDPCEWHNHKIGDPPKCKP